MSELLGFIVLSGPIFPVLVWLVVSIVVVTVAVHPAGNVMRRTGVRLLVFVAILLLPFVDEIVGRLYLGYLCNTQAGAIVYRTVELPAEYWDEEGNPLFLEKNGNYHLNAYPPKYKTGTYSSVFHIDNSGYSIVNAASGKVLGDVTDFRYWGGWVRRNFSTHNSANSCKGRAERFENIIRRIFSQENVN